MKLYRVAYPKTFDTTSADPSEPRVRWTTTNAEAQHFFNQWAERLTTHSAQYVNLRLTLDQLTLPDDLTPRQLVCNLLNCPDFGTLSNLRTFKLPRTARAANRKRATVDDNGNLLPGEYNSPDELASDADPGL